MWFKRQLMMFMIGILGATATTSESPVEISPFNEALSHPFSGTVLKNPASPVQHGKSLLWRGLTRYSACLTIRFKVMFHEFHLGSIAACVDFSDKPKLNFRIIIKSEMGRGFMHIIGSREENPFIDGISVNLPGKGSQGFTPAFSVGMEFQLQP